MGQIANCKYISDAINAAKPGAVNPSSSLTVANCEYLLTMIDAANAGATSYGTGAYATTQIVDKAAVDDAVARLLIVAPTKRTWVAVPSSVGGGYSNLPLYAEGNLAELIAANQVLTWKTATNEYSPTTPIGVLDSAYGLNGNGIIITAGSANIGGNVLVTFDYGKTWGHVWCGGTLLVGAKGAYDASLNLYLFWSGSTETRATYRSTNGGITWTSGFIPTFDGILGNISAITAVTNKFVIFGGGNSNVTTRYSTDGINWSQGATTEVGPYIVAANDGIGYINAVSIEASDYIAHELQRNNTNAWSAGIRYNTAGRAFDWRAIHMNRDATYLFNFDLDRTYFYKAPSSYSWTAVSNGAPHYNITACNADPNNYTMSIPIIGSVSGTISMPTTTATVAPTTWQSCQKPVGTLSGGISKFMTWAPPV
jgi:hypothetical protein